MKTNRFYFMGYAVIFTLLSLCLSGCHDPKNPDEVIDINLTEASKAKKTIPLSELVKKVEYIRFESNLDCFMDIPTNMHFFGKKYVLFHDNRNNQFFLFNRDGSFKCKIGANGKGPGEYGRESIATLSKDETKIIISDGLVSKVLIFNTEGDVLLQKDLSSYFPSRHITDLYCDFGDRITFQAGRPYEPVDGYASLVFFDFDLNKIGEVLPRANDDHLTYVNLRHQASFSNKEGTFFWEMYKDTVYQYNKEGQAEPRFHFTVEKNNLTESLMRNRDIIRELYNYSFPLFLNWLPDYLSITTSGGLGWIFYSVKSEEAFQVTIDNDIYALSLGLTRYSPDQDLCAVLYRWGDYAKNWDLTELKAKEVAHPDIRDELISFAEEPPEDLGPVVVLHHLR